MLNDAQLSKHIEQEIAGYRLYARHLRTTSAAYETLSSVYDEALRKSYVIKKVADCIEADLVGFASI